MRHRNPCSPSPGRRFVALWLLLVASLLASCSSVRTPSARPSVRLAPAPYFDDQTGIYFPGALDALHRQPVIDLEQRTAGLGRAIPYSHRHARVDVFVYDLQASVIPVGIDSKIIEQTFADAIADLWRATERRIYSNLQLQETDTVKLAGRSFLHARFSYGENQLQKDGHLLVAGVNGQIIKIRASTARPASVDLWRIFGYLGQSIAQSGRNGFGGLTSQQLAAIETALARIDLSDGIDSSEAIAIAQMELVEQGRHNRFDASSAQLVDTSSEEMMVVQFDPFPTEPALPQRELQLVQIFRDGLAELVN